MFSGCTEPGRKVSFRPRCARNASRLRWLQARRIGWAEGG